MKTKVWRCQKCGIVSKTYSIDLFAIQCKCGIGQGVWAVEDMIKTDCLHPEYKTGMMSCPDCGMNHLLMREVI